MNPDQLGDSLPTLPGDGVQLRSLTTDDVPVAIRHIGPNPSASGVPSRRIVVAWRAGSSRGVEGRLLAETLKPVA